MKLSDFLALDAEEKKLAVLHVGVLIGKRADHLGMIFLFQLPGYYVETYCNAESKTIEEYRAFKSVAALTPYLESIGLDDLLN